MTKTILIASITTAVLLASILLVNSHLQENSALAIGSSGIDGFTSSATVALELFGVGPSGEDVSEALSVQGPTIIKRDPPDPSSGIIETEMVSMELTGSSPNLGPITVRVGQSFGLPASLGQIIPQSQARDFPADSFFDVFFEITVTPPGLGELCLRNSNELRLEAEIDRIPPTGHVYFPPVNPEPVLLFFCGDDPANTVGALTHAYHLPGTNEDLKVEIKKEIITLTKQSETERDNISISEIKLKFPQKLIMVDNAGIGGTSDVEVTWRFDPQTCMVQWLPFGLSPAVGANWVLFVNDAAFGVFAAHDDASTVESVALSAVAGTTCKLIPRNGDFVTVSTVRADG